MFRAPDYYRRLEMKMTLLSASAIALLAYAGASAATPQVDRADEQRWQRAMSDNTLQAYSRYLQNAGQSPHQGEALARLRALVQADLAVTREIAITAVAMDETGQKLVAGGLLKTVAKALEERGYRPVDAGCPNQLMVSMSIEKWLSGTAGSYWHYAALPVISITFAKEGSGPLFRKDFRGPMNSGRETHRYDALNLQPIDASSETFVNPLKGVSYGAGVVFTAPSRNTSAQAADALQFQNYDWGALINIDALLGSLRAALAKSPPLTVDDSAVWVF
jgi:hypothetical protein